MTKEIIQYLFTLTLRVARENVKETAEEDALLTLNGSSSVNWVLGHILRSKSDLLESINAARIHTQDELLYYRPTEEEPERSGEVLSMATVIRVLDEFHQPFIDAVWEALQKATEADTERVRKYILFYSFHESYHVGQIPLLQRLTGSTSLL